MNKKLITYSMPRTFNNFNIPISIQSTALRDYAIKNSYIFSLPSTENCIKNNYSVLKTILYKFKNKNLNLGVVSFFIFPVNDMKLINLIFKKYVNSNFLIHSVLENQIFSIKEFIEWSEKIGLVRKMSIDYNNTYLDEIISNID
tara:strand:- start:291 stop:722 length:432 start_codon:yes stop_codon:yes gene_type:complete